MINIGVGAWAAPSTTPSSRPEPSSPTTCSTKMPPPAGSKSARNFWNVSWLLGSNSTNFIHKVSSNISRNWKASKMQRGKKRSCRSAITSVAIMREREDKDGEWTITRRVKNIIKGLFLTTPFRREEFWLKSRRKCKKITSRLSSISRNFYWRYRVVGHVLSKITETGKPIEAQKQGTELIKIRRALREIKIPPLERRKITKRKDRRRRDLSTIFLGKTRDQQSISRTIKQSTSTSWAETKQKKSATSLKPRGIIPSTNPIRSKNQWSTGKQRRRASPSAKKKERVQERRIKLRSGGINI